VTRKKSPVCDARIDDAMADTNRIAKELREIASDTASGVTVSPHGDSLTHMKGTITGACGDARRAAWRGWNLCVVI